MKGHLPAKWKRFAMEQVLSSWSKGVPAEELFDWIDIATDAQLPELFCSYDVVVRQPFETWDSDEIASAIAHIAREAYETEGETA